MNELPFELTDKVKQDFIAQEDFWDSARKSNFIGYLKKLWDQFNRIEHLRNACAFCHYLECDDCPLTIDSSRCNSCEINYNKWKYTNNLQEKKLIAYNIYQIVKKFNNKYIREIKNG